MTESLFSDLSEAVGTMWRASSELVVAGLALRKLELRSMLRSQNIYLEFESAKSLHRKTIVLHARCVRRAKPEIVTEKIGPMNTV